MRVTYGREMQAKRRLDELDVENFLPMRYQLVAHRDGTRCRELVPAVSNLIFIHSTRQEIIHLKHTDQSLLPLRFMMNRTLDDTLPPQVMTVPDRQMVNFLRVASVTDERVLFLDNADLMARPGTYVRVISGPFGGVKGFIRRVSKNRRLIVQLKGVAAVALSCVSIHDLMPISEQEYNDLD